MYNVTTAEIRKLIDAADAGKTIQFLDLDGTWKDKKTSDIHWNFGTHKYRVKPDWHIRAFNDAAEFTAELKKHDNVIVDNRGNHMLVTSWNDDGVICGNFTVCYAHLAVYFTWQDTKQPVGVKESTKQK